MDEYLAADGLPVRVGDVVTRVNDDIDRAYYASVLVSGVVVSGYTTDFIGGEGGLIGVRVKFHEAEEPEFLDVTKGCLLKHIVHLDTNPITFDKGQFFSMLGV